MRGSLAESQLAAQVGGEWRRGEGLGGGVPEVGEFSEVRAQNGERCGGLGVGGRGEESEQRGERGQVFHGSRGEGVRGGQSVVSGVVWVLVVISSSLAMAWRACSQLAAVPTVQSRCLTRRVKTAPGLVRFFAAVIAAASAKKPVRSSGPIQFRDAANSYRVCTVATVRSVSRVRASGQPPGYSPAGRLVAGVWTAAAGGCGSAGVAGFGPRAARKMPGQSIRYRFASPRVGVVWTAPTVSARRSSRAIVRGVTSSLAASNSRVRPSAGVVSRAQISP